MQRSVDFGRGPLEVSSNARFLVHADGTPFFYLADTAWELFHRNTLEEAGRYLADRAQKRFTVVQAVALAEQEGLTVPNPNGDVPFHDLDPERRNEAYWEPGREPVPGNRIESFRTPDSGPDWVLVLDNARHGFPPPGRSA